MKVGPASRTIAEMSENERWEAYKTEILALVLASKSDDGDDDSSIDDEEKRLLEVLWRVYGLGRHASQRFQIPDEELLALETAGQIRNPDQQLGINVIRRILEPAHQALQNSDFERVVTWLRYRTGALKDDPFGKGPGMPWMGYLVQRWRRLERTPRRPAPTTPDAGHSPARPPAEQLPKEPGSRGILLRPEPEVVKESPLRHAVEERLRSSQRDGGAILDRIRKLASDRRFVSSVCAFGTNGLPGAPQIMVVSEADLAQVPEVWFAGDVHGDLLALEAVCQAFEKRSAQGSKLVFLGDLIDDGFHGREVVLAIWRRMLESPGRYAWIAGNHDEGLHWSEETSSFVSRVSPSDFEEWLNENLADPSVVDLGRTFIRVVRELPRALFLPGILAAHAGFPHADTWDAIKVPADLAAGRGLGDFVWNRWANARQKIPNRASSQSSFGSEDFHGFRAVCARLGLRVEGMVRGHDHIDERPERWERKESVPRGDFEGRILTINTLSYTQRRELNPYAPKNPRSPALARWSRGEFLPTPVVVKIDALDVEWYAPICAKCGHPNRTGAPSCESIVPGTERMVRCGGTVRALSRA